MAPATIGILEHDPTLRTLLAEVLTDEGYAVALYAYPPPPADLLAAAPALLVLDYNPGDDPLVDQVVRTSRQREPVPIPVLFCSTEAGLVRARWGGEPAVAVCAKPFDVEELLALVARLLAGPRATAGARPPALGSCAGNSEAASDPTEYNTVP